MAKLVALGDPWASDDTHSCAWWLWDCQHSGLAFDPYLTAAVRVMKQDDGAWTLNGSVCQRVAKPQLTADVVREQVERLVPAAAIGLAPKGATLVNIQTIMWVATPERRTLAPLTILGRRVVVRLRIERVDWGFGDGRTDSAPTAGKPYDGANDPCKTVDCPDYYGHTYVDAGRMTVTASANWVASFTADGGPPVAIPATVAGPVARTALQVRQARGVLVPDPTR